MAMVQVPLFSCRTDWGWILVSLDFLLLSLCLIVILQAWISIKVSAWSGQISVADPGSVAFFLSRDPG
jgi:protein-S-isoprenylcysteine O-methyltransferase Ste14